MRKRILGILLICMVCVESVNSVFAETSTDVKKQQEETQEALDQVTERMDDIEEQKESVSEEIVVLDSQLVDVLTSISICEDEIAEKEDEIWAVKGELKKTQEEADKQYAEMVMRIRFMYEKSDNAYMSILLQSENYTDMINKASFVEELYAYDRALLDDFQLTITQIGEYKAQLEIEEADLVTCKEELAIEQDHLQTILDEKKARMENFESELAQATAQANAFKNQLKEQNKKIKELEQKEEAERKEKERKQAEENRKAQLTAGNGNVEATITAVATSSEGSAKGREMAAYGCQFIGNPYVFGGTSLTNGTDCSGFTQGVCAHFGIKIPRDSTSQRSCGVGVSYADAQPGDIICYAGHVGMYIGNGQIVHASSARTGIKISPATYRTILAVRRVVS